MKKSNTFIIIVLLIALLTNPVFGYAGMGGNNSGANMGDIIQNEEENIDPANTTQSDQDIEISSHLIEVDANRPELQDKLYVRETIVFRNTGSKIFVGTLKTYVPDGLVEIKIMKAQMMTESSGQSIVPIQNGNIISWQDQLGINSVPMYVIEYIISTEQKGTLTKSLQYSKRLLSPTLINYKYSPSPGYPVFILKISKSMDSSITLKDENGNRIVAEDNIDEDSSIVSRFNDIQFKELNIEFSKSAIDNTNVLPYLIIGLLIVLVLVYPVIRKKSPKLQEIEGKIRNSLKRETESKEQQETDEEGSEEEPEEREEEGSTPEDEDLSGKSKDKLETEKNELLSKLKKLEKDYASGDLIDEEYEELRNSYQVKLKKIERRIE
ncbi:MAG: hypothetical protein KKG76_00910 [Euryarchaeota archaeon]|nr:hypothetical protein [Euryarchaeota archaeon]MBU4138878.1 hypothetical protein [Euryarchaeota archaeon]